MEVVFKDNQLRKRFTESALAMRKWGADVGKRYIRRVLEIQALDTFDEIFGIAQFRAHPYKSIDGLYAIDLIGRWRLMVSRGERTDQIFIAEVSNHYDD